MDASAPKRPVSAPAPRQNQSRTGSEHEGVGAEKMEQGTTLHVGLDVHARTIEVSVLRGGTKNREEWRLENEERAVRALARRLRHEGVNVVVCCYEAGPTGFALQRQLQARGVD